MEDAWGSVQLVPVDGLVLPDLLHTLTHFVEVDGFDGETAAPMASLAELLESALGFQTWTFTGWMTPVGNDGSDLERVRVTDTTLAELLAINDRGAQLETEEENAGKTKWSPCVVNVNGHLWVGNNPPNGFVLYAAMRREDEEFLRMAMQCDLWLE